MIEGKVISTTRDRMPVEYGKDAPAWQVVIETPDGVRHTVWVPRRAQPRQGQSACDR